MFENLSDKILTSLKKVRGQNKISESNIEEVVKEIRLSLLEADVNFKVVKSLIHLPTGLFARFSIHYLFLKLN